MSALLPVCPSCRDFFRRHARLLRWAIGLTLLALFGFWVGANAPVTTIPLMCRIYG